MGARTRTRTYATGTTTAIVTEPKPKENGTEDEHWKRPIEEDPILREFLLTRGIDITDAESVASHITKEDVKIGELPDPEIKQWKKDSRSKLMGKKRRIHNKNYRGKLSERDGVLKPELSLIKQHLTDTDSIDNYDKILKKQVYKAYVVVTGKTHQTTFNNRLNEYEDHGYLEATDSKRTSFRALRKFLDL